jgi:hypothetical protein
MQDPSRFLLMKRLLFPYSGESPLSLRQGLRVVLAWMLAFPLLISLFTLPVSFLAGFNAQGVAVNCIFAFLLSAFIFGLSGLLVVLMSNRAAHIRQAWKAQNGRS